MGAVQAPTVAAVVRAEDEGGGEIVAEFAEVIRQWKRMCKSFTSNDDEDCCKGCPVLDLREHGCGAIFEDDFLDNTTLPHYEARVNQWAAEHPEPVYPTLGEWLMSIGIINDVHPHGAIDALVNLKQPIPSDIAEKLGIEPKEGVC